MADQLLPAFVDSLVSEPEPEPLAPNPSPNPNPNPNQVATAINPVFPPVPALQQAKLAKAGS